MTGKLLIQLLLSYIAQNKGSQRFLTKNRKIFLQAHDAIETLYPELQDEVTPIKRRTAADTHLEKLAVADVD